MTLRERRRYAMPLSQFSKEDQARIEFLASQPTPPPKWLRLEYAQIISRAWCEWHWRRQLEPGEREPVGPRLRALIVARDGYVCGLCGGDVEPSDVHIDHIRQVAEGGPTVASNLRVTHSLCNLRRPRVRRVHL